MKRTRSELTQPPHFGYQAGNLHVSLQSAARPDGEIRAQPES
jgi:hypothetical protein